MARLPAAGKTLAVIIAVLLAAAATYAIWVYVDGIEQRAFEDAELVEVFVAEEQIPAGLSAQEASETGLIVRDTKPRTVVPDGAIGSLDQLGGLVALERILTGEVIVADRFGQPDEVIGEAFEIPEGHEAISVEVGLVPGVAGYVRSGDQISMIATLVAPTGEELDEDQVPVDEDGEPVDPADVVVTDTLTQYLLQDVEVLAVGPRRPEDAEGGEAVGSTVLLTVALEPIDAERLVYAINQADLHFTLLPEDAEPQETPGRTIDDLFDE